jgi:hypothetical protein
MIAGVRVEIWTRQLQSTKQDHVFCTSDDDNSSPKVTIILVAYSPTASRKRNCRRQCWGKGSGRWTGMGCRRRQPPTSTAGGTTGQVWPSRTGRSRRSGLTLGPSWGDVRSHNTTWSSRGAAHCYLSHRRHFPGTPPQPLHRPRNPRPHQEVEM